MESHTTADAFNEIVDQPVERQGGYFVVADRPGIGVEIQEHKLKQFPYKPKKITGAFYRDGAVAH
jgi:L-alanine-DL-glutamate epimerase-like enolase superfamily enzyme